MKTITDSDATSNRSCPGNEANNQPGLTIVKAHSALRRRLTTLLKLAVIGAVLITSVSGFAQPIIIKQPQSQTNLAGTTATFSLEASGTQPLSYQWRSYSSSTAFTNILGETNTSLVLTNVQQTS